MGAVFSRAIDHRAQWNRLSFITFSFAAQHHVYTVQWKLYTMFKEEVNRASFLERLQHGRCDICVVVKSPGKKGALMSVQ